MSSFTKDSGDRVSHKSGDLVCSQIAYFVNKN